MTRHTLRPPLITRTGSTSTRSSLRSFGRSIKKRCSFRKKKGNEEPIPQVAASGRAEQAHRDNVNTPPRSSRMPKEVHITPGTPDSAFSAISGTTELPEYQSRSMFKSVLPDINSETEECSIDRSIFTWNMKDVNESENSNEGKTQKVLFGDSDSFKCSTKIMMGKRNFVTKSKRFQNLVNKTFKSVDLDNSGAIDKIELYTGLLLIHLNLAAYVGSAACRPPSKEYVNKMFDTLDKDKTGTLNKDEYLVLMTILCSQITTRIALQLAMTMMVVPLMAQYLIDAIQYIIHFGYVAYKGMNGSSVVMYEISESIIGIFGHVWGLCVLLTPRVIQSYVLLIAEHMKGFLTTEVLTETLPLTTMSCALGCLLVPWLLYQCDEFYNKIASRKKSSMEKKTIYV
mmetsp:Transcript_27810/g.34351  ORF Transcript_27810/g.34351 Transcript_27810/m.34351 type:complete len:399 (-) Transcript_27810:197-1393(-)